MSIQQMFLGFSGAASTDTSFGTPWDLPYGSVEFDGSDDTLYIANHADLELGSETNWTVEFWFKKRLDNGDWRVVVGKGQYEWYIETFSNGNLKFLWVDENNSTWTGQPDIATGLSLNTWYHISVNRNGNDLKSFVDGIQAYSGSITGNIRAGGGTFSLGGWYQGSNLYTNCIISNFRLVKGTTVYHTQYSPSPWQLTDVENTKLLCCSDKSSATAATVTPGTITSSGGASAVSDTPIINGAVHFDGSGDSCTVGPNSDFTMGTGDFTIECWVSKDNNQHRGIWQICDSPSGFTTSDYGTTLALGYQVGVWQIYGNSVSVESASFGITANQWYHTAYVRHNGVSKLYVDGVEVLSQNDTYNYNGTYIGFGGYYNTSYLHHGKISNLRVVKGQALYKSNNFNPPSTALTLVRPGVDGVAFTVTTDGSAYNSSGNCIETGNGSQGTGTLASVLNSDGSMSSNYQIGNVGLNSTTYWEVEFSPPITTTSEFSIYAGAWADGAYAFEVIITYEDDTTATTTGVSAYQDYTFRNSFSTSGKSVKKAKVNRTASGGYASMSGFTKDNSNAVILPTESSVTLKEDKVGLIACNAKNIYSAYISVPTGTQMYSSNPTIVGGRLDGPDLAFDGSSSTWTNLYTTSTSTAASVDFVFPTELTNITRIEAAFDSPSGSGDTRGRYNGANAGATRSGTGSGWSDIYNGSAITVTSVGYGINQNGATGTSNEILSRFRVTTSTSIVYSDYVSASSGYAHPAVNAFDGSTSTRCEPSDNSTVIVDFTGFAGGGITVNSSLRIYLTKAGNPSASHFTVNGTNLGGSVPSGDWLTVSTSKLETITFYHASGSSSVELFAVEVDGSILTDSGPTILEDARRWIVPIMGDPTADAGPYGPYSSMLSGSLKTPEAGFDSDYTSGRSEGTGGLTFTPSIPIPYSGSVEVYDNNNVTKSRVNSGGFVQHVTDGWATISSGTGTITSMYFERSDNAGWDAGFRGIRVDGNLLVDP